MLGAHNDKREHYHTQRNTKNITYKAQKRGEKNPVPVSRRLDHLRLLILEGHNYNLKILARVLTIASKLYVVLL